MWFMIKCGVYGIFKSVLWNHLLKFMFRILSIGFIIDQNLIIWFAYQYLDDDRWLMLPWYLIVCNVSLFVNKKCFKRFKVPTMELILGCLCAFNSQLGAYEDFEVDIFIMVGPYEFNLSQWLINAFGTGKVQST